MVKKRHAVEQIIAELREAEVLLAKGTKMPQVCRSLGVTEQTYYRWRKEYGGVRTDQVTRLDLQESNQVGVHLADDVHEAYEGSFECDLWAFPEVGDVARPYANEVLGVVGGGKRERKQRRRDQGSW